MYHNTLPPKTIPWVSKKESFWVFFHSSISEAVPVKSFFILRNIFYKKIYKFLSSFLLLYLLVYLQKRKPSFFFYNLEDKTMTDLFYKV